MEVKKVEITLSGKYDLAKLAELRYRQRKDAWIFDGVQHRYIFQPVQDQGLKITIVKKPGSRLTLEHFITFTQIRDWVGESVNRIQVGGRR